MQTAQTAKNSAGGFWGVQEEKRRSNKGYKRNSDSKIRCFDRFLHEYIEYIMHFPKPRIN